MPLVALLGLVHLRITLTRTVLGRAGRCNQRDINDRASLEHQAFGDQGGVDRGQQLNAQVVLFKQVAKAHDGGRVVHSDQACIEAAELAVKRRVVQNFFHRRIGQAKPLLQKMDVPHGLDGKARTAAFGARARRREQLDQTHQFPPRKTKLISSRNTRFRVRLVASSNPLEERLIFFIVQRLSGRDRCQGLQRFPRRAYWLDGMLAALMATPINWWPSTSILRY
jgi:hypothetical protein